MPGHPRALLIQKTAEASEEIINSLKSSSDAPEFTLCLSLEEFNTKHAAEAYDLIISHYSFDGGDVLQLLRRPSTSGPQVPLVVYADPIGDERVALLLRSGAADFVVRGNWNRLAVVVRREIQESAKRLDRKVASDARVTAYAAMEREIQRRNEELHRMNRLLREEVVVRRKAEETQAATSQRLAMTLRAAKAGSFEWDITRDVIVWSDEMRDLYGLDANYPLGGLQNRLEMILAEDKGRVEAALTEAMQSGIFDVEFRFRRQDTGEVRWIYARGQMIFDELMKPIKLVGINIDITERKQLEQNLSEANQRLEAHLANSPLAIIEFDGIFTIKRWSSEAERMFGWSATEVIGKRIGDFRWVHDDDISRVAGLSHDMVHGLSPRNVHANRNYRKDGTVIHCEWYNSAVRNEHGRLVSVFSQVLDVTERKSFESKLRHQADLLDVLNDAVISVDTSFRITSWNKAAEHIYGWTEEEVLGKVGKDVLRSEMTTEQRDAVYAELLAGNPVSTDLFQYTKDNRKLNIGGYTIPMKSSQGEIVGYVAVNRDITDIKRAEESKLAAQRELQAVTNIMAAGVTRCSRDLRYLWVSPAYAKWLGQTPEQIAGRPIVDVVGAAGVEAIRPHIEEVLSGKPVDYEAEVNFIGPGQRWIHAKYNPTVDASGQVNGWVAVVADITEQKRSEEDLRQSEARYRLLHESLRDAFVETTMDGRIVECNRVYCQILGYSIEELRTLTYQELTPERWHAFEDRIVREQVIPLGYSEVYEKEYRRKDGSVFPVELRTVMTRDAHGRPTGMWALVRDISERKRAQEALTQHLKNIEYISSSATHLLEPTAHETIFDYVSHQVTTLAGQAIVIVSEYDATFDQTIIRALGGPDHKMQRVMGLLGREPLGMTLPVAVGILPRMVSGCLVRVEGGVHDLSFGHLPLALCNKIEQDLSIGEIYAMPFIHQEDFMGTVAILTDSAEGLINKSVIEACINQAGLALKRQRAELSLRKSELQFRELANALPLLVWIVDQDGNILYANRQLAEYAGKVPSTMSERFALLHDLDYERAQRTWEDAVNSGADFECEYRLRRHDGEYRWFRARVKRSFDANGKPTGWFGTETDIHDVKASLESITSYRDQTSL